MIARLREVIEAAATPGFHHAAKDSPRYWTWRVQTAFIETGRALGDHTVLPPAVKYHPRTRRITRRTTGEDGEASHMPTVVDVAWLRDHRFSREDYEKGRTGMVAALMCEWGSSTPHHVASGRMNWKDVRTVMGAFSKLVFVKAPVKVMAFTTRRNEDSGGDNWEFLTNMMTAQARAMFRTYPVREEYALVAWPFGATTLERFRHSIVVVG